MEDELLEGVTALRRDKQAVRLPTGDEGLLDRAPAGNQLLVLGEGLDRRSGGLEAGAMRPGRVRSVVLPGRATLRRPASRRSAGAWWDPGLSRAAMVGPRMPILVVWARRPVAVVRARRPVARILPAEGVLVPRRAIRPVIRAPPEPLPATGPPGSPGTISITTRGAISARPVGLARRVATLPAAAPWIGSPSTA